jgi:rfaE bifunctional protein kinase chain/domain/rfaE bifunctional protein nucleotidyltransferase chain/domain
MILATEQSNHTATKVSELTSLAEVVARLKAGGKKIVHCHGVFDLLHIGHIRHLESAKKFGDILVVTLTPDIHVNKGPGRPVFSEHLRAEAIAALKCVDYVAVNKWPMAVETITLLQPNFYVKGVEYGDAGKDQTGGISLEENAVRSVNGELVFTDDITFSSSSLINNHLPVLPKEVRDYLTAFTSGKSVDDVISYLHGARDLRVLVVGEAIIDEYQYCQTIGKAGKEPILAARYLKQETFAGGILAVANHVAAFADRVSLTTFLGDQDSREAFIREKLDPKIDKAFLFLENAPTIVKRRFVENYPFQKLFEISVMDEGAQNARQSEALCARLERVLPDFDVVIVADFGHGMLSSEAVDVLCERARFLAVNTQMNADNHGFNTVSKYHRADYVCVSESEIRLEARNRRKDLRSIVQQISDKLSCGKIMITRGAHGALCYSHNDGFFDVPALASHVVDRVGAGDAVLSVTSLCVAQNAPVEIVGLIGNAVGAQAVNTVGNARRIEKVPLIRFIQSALK